MTAMSDTLKRGITFDGVTGLKTGANLEDLVTRVSLTSGSQLLDQVMLEDFADAALVDDYGVALRRARIKDASITAAKLVATARYGTKQTLVSGDITAPEVVGITDWANMLDGNDATETAEGSGTAGSGHYRAAIYRDLGAVYDGWIRLRVKYGVAGTGTYYQVTAAPFWSIATPVGFDGAAGNLCSGASLGANYSVTKLDRSCLQPFVGRYVGIYFLSYVTDFKFNMSRFDIYL